MNKIHLVTPRTGPNNEGPCNCEKCGAVVFDSLGQIAYGPGELHTTDLATWKAGVEANAPEGKDGELVMYNPCVTE